MVNTGSRRPPRRCQHRSLWVSDSGHVPQRPPNRLPIWNPPVHLMAEGRGQTLGSCKAEFHTPATEVPRLLTLPSCRAQAVTPSAILNPQVIEILRASPGFDLDHSPGTHRSSRSPVQTSSARGSSPQRRTALRAVSFVEVVDVASEVPQRVDTEIAGSAIPLEGCPQRPSRFSFNPSTADPTSTATTSPRSKPSTRTTLTTRPQPQLEPQTKESPHTPGRFTPCTRWCP